MTENKKLKRKLIVQSFLPLSILIVIKSVTKETLGKIYCLLDSILHKCNIIETIQETGLRDDIWQILIGIIALWFAISGFITFWQFRQARFTAFNDDGDKIVIEDKIQDSGISFFMTFILSLLVDKVSTVNEFISYILVMWFVAELMLRIKQYNVVKLKSKELIKKIQKTERWRETFTIINGKIQLNTYKDVEHLIDLFDERYTKSLITNDEFDTDVKRIAKKNET